MNHVELQVISFEVQVELSTVQVKIQVKIYIKLRVLSTEAQVDL